jgi:hypothetical protein
MLSKTVKAATTITDQGEFTAIAAAYTVDRMGDQIMAGAFKSTIEAWQASGKNIPLHWDHGGNPSDIIGSVDPAQMREADEGLYVKGQLDLVNSEMAREAWRVMKENAVGLSFGYLVQDEFKNESGVNELKALDLFEITITPAPANPDTKLLSLKNATEAEEVADVGREGEPLGDGIMEAIDKSNLAQADKDKLKSLYLADVEQRIKGATAQEPSEATAQASDSLSKGYEDIAFRLSTHGIVPEFKSPPVEEPPPEGPSLDELRRDHDRTMYRLLTGSKEV